VKPPLEGKVAIVTGASRGIGRAIVQRLAAEGAWCLCAARDGVLLDALVGEIGNRASYFAIDLRDPAAPATVVSAAIERYGQLDIVINNAGATRRGEFLDLTEEDWYEGFALKFFAAMRMRMCRFAWPYLKWTEGSIVNIAGIGGRTPGAQFAVGGSVNAALLSLTKSLAETGIADGIQVNAINPGAVRTDRLQVRLAGIAAQDMAAAEAAFVRGERLSRIGEPEDIAALVAFLVSPQGRFLHGALIDMDGGATKTI
jgi:3-oxoacyl-[acyl-carrier protein] reductase